MKIKLLVLFAFSLLFSCAAKKGINNIEEDEKTGKEIYVGYVDESGLNSVVFPGSSTYYNDYEVNDSIVDLIYKNSEGVSVFVVFATWCGDSQRNVPVFEKIVDYSGIKKESIKYVAVDRKKKAPVINSEDLDIQRVPTFIFYKNNQEIGRIVENPSGENIESDWLDILMKR